MKRLAIALSFVMTVTSFGMVPVPFVLNTSIAEAAGSGSTPTCRKGETYSRRQKRCVRDQSSELTVDDLVQTASAWAAVGDYNHVIQVLWLTDGREDARVLNLLGFANRKLGRIDVGLSYYRQAIEMDPTYVLVRAYFAEGLLQVGDLDGAKAQLTKIAELCGDAGCAEHDELLQTIEQHIDKL